MALSFRNIKLFWLAGLLLSLAPRVFSQATSDQYLAAANQLYGTKDFVRAAQYYKASVQVDPNNAAAYRGLGNCEYSLGQRSEALGSYEKAQALDPNDAQLSNFIQALKNQIGAGQPALPQDNGTGVLAPLPFDPSIGTAPGSAPTTAAKADSEKYNSWNGGHNYARNLVDMTFGAAFSGQGTGFGLGSTYSFPIDKNFSVGVGSNIYIFSSSQPLPGGTLNETSYYTEALLTLKYMFSGNTIRPFIFGGGGLNVAINTLSTTGSGYYSYGYSDFSYSFDPMATFGGGIAFPLSEYVAFFVQGKISIVFAGASSNTSLSPGGFSSSLTTGGGSITYIPLEAGLTLPI